MIMIIIIESKFNKWKYSNNGNDDGIFPMMILVIIKYSDNESGIRGKRR